MSQQTKSLLCYMDFATHTGFSSVAHNVLDRLLPYFQENNVLVSICATNYLGQPFWYEGKNGGKAYVRSAKDYAKNMNDLWYRDGMLKLLNEKNWDIFWAINDIPVFSPMMGVLNDIRSKFKYQKKQTRFKAILYTPVDSPCNPMFMNDLNFWDSLVTYTEYGKKQIERFEDNPISPRTIDVIPHGANRSDFYPIKDFDIQEGRKKWKLPKNGFIFGNVNKNNSRKNIGGTLLAFRNFLDWYQKNEKLNHTLPQPYLYLHCSPTDDTGINCYRACESLGISKYVFYPEKEEYKKGAGYTTEEMNEVYNCLNCYVTTTGAEGWGLTITEAMAVGLPIVAPLHTSIKEICENGAACYPVSILSEQILTHDYENVRFIPDPVNTAFAMTQAYNDVIEGKFPHKNAYTDILAEYDWDKIAEQWKQIFSKHL
jgi:glycosyltransferase involved in cell wall biosynthesis